MIRFKTEILGQPRVTQLYLVGSQYPLNRVYQQVDHCMYDWCYVPDWNSKKEVHILGKVRNVELGGHVEYGEPNIRMSKHVRVEFIGTSECIGNVVSFNVPHIKEFCNRLLFDTGVSSYQVDGWLDYLDKSNRIYIKKVFVFEDMFDFASSEDYSLITPLLQYE